jgi:creatinine amidohydrolase
VLVLNWWELLPADQLDDIFAGSFPGWEAEHAGIAETSLMLHLHPERVRRSLIEDRMAEIGPPRYTALPERAGLVDPSGVLRTAHGSTAETGRRIQASVLAATTVVLHDEWGIAR